MTASASDALRVLADVFGYSEFRPGQREAVSALAEGRDVVAVMPTGAGKSICFQVPALMAEGTALVVSPLVSLMADQVQGLRLSGVSAAYVNSTLSGRERADVLRGAAAGEYKMLYVTPERLADDAFVDAVSRMDVSLVAVDEAHCVSQWGQDFRPSFLKIAQFVELLSPRPPVIALTATATSRVQRDISELLRLESPAMVHTGFDRPNLHYDVEHVASGKKLARIHELVQAHEGESGIVYCTTRKDVDGIHEGLAKLGVRAVRYHGGMDARDRAESQRAFVSEDACTMVATKAFGMGIDKSNVRYVVHHNMPSSLEDYYQEAGRAGRDGQPSDCMLLWCQKDIQTCRFLIDQEPENEELSFEERSLVHATQLRLLAVMSAYCVAGGCLRKYILDYFQSKEEADGCGRADGAEGCGGVAGARAGGGAEGSPGVAGAEGSSGVAGGEVAGAGAGASAAGIPSASSAAHNCGNCGNCDGSHEMLDVTQTARAVMRCVKELRGGFGKGMVADVLCGSSSKEVQRRGFERLATFGSVDVPATQVKEVVELLSAGGYLEIADGKFPTVGFGPRFREVADEGFELKMRKVPRGKKVREKAASKRVVGDLTASDQQLFERLRALRRDIASEEEVPPYVVFSDAVLVEMCAARPESPEALLQVKGVGQKKLESYGEAFLAEIAAFE